MSTFLTNLVRRAQGKIQVIRPMPSSPYASTVRHVHDHSSDNPGLEPGIEREVDVDDSVMPESVTSSIPFETTDRPIPNSENTATLARVSEIQQPNGLDQNRTPPVQTVSISASDTVSNSPSIIRTPTPASTPVVRRRVAPDTSQQVMPNVTGKIGNKVAIGEPIGNQSSEEITFSSPDTKVYSSADDKSTVVTSEMDTIHSFTRPVKHRSPEPEPIHRPADQRILDDIQPAKSNTDFAESMEINKTNIDALSSARLTDVKRTDNPSSIAVSPLSAVQSSITETEIPSRPTGDSLFTESPQPVFTHNPSHINVPHRQLLPQTVEISIGRLEVQVVQPEKAAPKTVTQNSTAPNPHNISLSKFLAEDRKR